MTGKFNLFYQFKPVFLLKKKKKEKKEEASVGFPKQADTIEIRQLLPYKLLYLSLL